MSNVSRRAFLRSAPAAAAAVALATPVLASLPSPARTHVEQVREKVAELKALMLEANPDFYWIERVGATADCPLLLSLTRI